MDNAQQPKFESQWSILQLCYLYKYIAINSEAKSSTFNASMAVVVAQLVERSLSIPEVRSSTPVIGKVYIEHLFVY